MNYLKINCQRNLEFLKHQNMKKLNNNSRDQNMIKVNQDNKSILKLKL